MVCRLLLSRGDRVSRATVGGREARFTAPRGLEDEVEDEDIVVPSDFVPDTLARLNDLGPRPRPEPSVRLRLTAAELALALATRSPDRAAAMVAGEPERAAVRQVVAGFREHWRVEASWQDGESGAGHVVEVVDTNGGLWLVVPEGDSVELTPTTPTAVWRLLTVLILSDQEREILCR